MLDQLNDEQLMSTFKQKHDINNQRAFEMLYARHKGPFYRFITKSINNEQDAHELYQELWFKIINNKDKFNEQQKFTTWAYTIARRLLIDQFRKTGRMAELSRLDNSEPDELADTGLPSPENEFTAKQMSRQLNQTISQLPHSQRHAFLLKCDGELSIKEIAEITQQPHEKVKSQYRYAVNKIKLALEHFK
ncbi:sigma-70 family RNA polymerase sigma factor [Marinicella sp. S1101]|uniref:sigma-70 family RNA polymerase sigma factor n=1 Tax=Marinicella marina TaxID=2996016 RepID=UPI0022610276|nr:sigma-70 family RNA polymerase sigma factor [Marinicella marina]MCX7555009.1 sigma-70 family RNA polymerase sigma factor [Marinicella marina]MDJ1141327.1 sigma-70 family RNA polymerase sigma factor [Marinicella marina]